MNLSRPRLTLLAMPALLVACASPVPLPDAAAVQQAQAIEAQAVWHAPVPHGGSATELSHWWATHDPLTGSLVQAAQRESATLASAATRMARARQALVQEADARWPAAALGASATRGVQTPQTAPATSTWLGLQASWELDLFGKNQAQHDAAALRSRSAELGWHAARVSLAADVAALVSGLRYCEQSLAVFRQDANSRAQTARLADLTAQAGLASPATSALARASSADAQSQLLLIQAQCEAQLKALVALSGLAEPQLREKFKQNPDQAHMEYAHNAHFSIASIPADLLQQRPDIAAAQLAVAAAAFDARVADAQRYPMLSLSGSIGQTRLLLGNATLDGRTWSLGPVALTLPITNARVTDALTRTAIAAYDEAVLQLRAAVRQAVREVEQALVHLGAAHGRERSAQTAATGYRAAHDAVQSRHRAGLASLTELEDARRLALQAQQSLLAVERDRAAALISLYRAAGGGWTAQTPLPSSLSTSAP